MTAAPRFIVGIDLGTTHTALASSPLEAAVEPEVFAIEQLTGDRELMARPLLPSCLYLPLEGDWLVGEFARRRGTEQAGRLIASAKSWLSHASVDRQAPILPWASADVDEELRLSPVAASARILEHLRACWERAHPEAPLAEQQLVLTVPASFDQGARQLTLQAAQSAGLSPRLLEEPQAAFYDYLARHGVSELEALLGGGDSEAVAHVLICDVGGGTTDLSLLSVQYGSDGVAVDRSAVGRHLLLGGDNIDHALAHTLEGQLAGKERLDPILFSQLVLRCREAKERLLAEGAPEAQRITLARSGSALVGATLSADLTREQVHQVTLDGFFPPAALGQTMPRRAAGLLTFGLPYERDPAITRHVASFVARHLAPEQTIDALLLNGGVFHAPAIVSRLVEVVQSFSDKRLKVLRHADPDLAVARGAVVFGQALNGSGLRIGGGSAHGYYVGLGGARQQQVMCVVPRGAKESERHLAPTPLKLKLGRAVRFELFASECSVLHAPGEVVPLNDDDFEALPQVVAEFESSQGDAAVDVQVAGELTPVGTLDLECLETGPSGRRFRLAFELRGQEAPKSRRSGAPSARETTPLARADEAVARVFGKGRKDVKEREIKDLVRELERLLGARESWSAELTRALFDVIAPKHKARRRSADHERVYFMLTGFCLRPGFGYQLDRERVALVWPLFEQGVTFGSEARVWQQFFICWRRIAGGLNEAQQLAIADKVEPFVAPEEAKLKRPKGFKPQGPEEMIELLSRLERLPVKRRLRFAHWMLERTWTSRDPRLWAAIGRVGARVTAYASVHHVLPAAHAEELLDHLLRERWDELKSAPYAAMLLARRTDDRARDVSESLRKEVVSRLRKLDVRQDFIHCVEEMVATGDRDRAEFLGEDLPVGLVLESELT